MTVWSVFNWSFDTVVQSMQNTPNIENTEINVSMNRHLVYFLCTVLQEIILK